MMMTERTKKLKTAYHWLTFFHILFMFGPLLVFACVGFGSSDVVAEKITLSLTAIISIIMALISVIVSVERRAGLHRTMMWILIIGIMFCLKEVGTFIMILGVTSVVDEIIVIPLMNKYKQLTIVNKEIDKRG